MKRTCALLIVLIILTCCLTGCLLTKKEYEHWKFDYAVEDIQSIKIIEIKEGAPNKIIKEIETSKAQEVCNDITALTMYTFVISMGSPMDPYGLCILIEYNSGEYDIIADSGSKKYRYDEQTGIIKNPTSWLYSDETEFEALINKYLN